MKFAFLVALLVAPSAFACPDLAGNYTCRSKKGDPMKLFLKQARAGLKDEYRVRFVGNAWLGEGQSIIRVPDRWKQDEWKWVSVCKDATFSMIGDAVMNPGERVKLSYIFEKTGAGSLRFRHDMSGPGGSGNLMDYDCRQ